MSRSSSERTLSELHARLLEETGGHHPKLVVHATVSDDGTVSSSGLYAVMDDSRVWQFGFDEYDVFAVADDIEQLWITHAAQAGAGATSPAWNDISIVWSSDMPVDIDVEFLPEIWDDDWNSTLHQYEWIARTFPNSSVGFFTSFVTRTEEWRTADEYAALASALRAQSPAPAAASKSDEATMRRGATCSHWGQMEEVVEPLLDPGFTGGPVWPSRPAWQVIDLDGADRMTLIVSDGLSNPWPDTPDGIGTGIEVATIGPVPPDQIHGSWLLHLATQLSHNAAHHGGWADLVERDGTISIQLAAIDELAHLATTDGAIGVLLAPWRTLELPNGEATVLAATLLTPDELDHITRPPNDQRATGRRALLDRLEAADVAHRCLPDRPSVLA